MEVETGSKDGADGSEIVGDDDGNQNSAENETEDKGVANEDTGAGGANKKDGKAENQPASSQEGVDFDKLTSNLPDMNGKQVSPGNKRGKSHKALLTAHKRTEDGVCLVEQVVSIRGKGAKRQVQLKWGNGEVTWQTFVPPYKDLTDEIGELNNVFSCLH